MDNNIDSTLSALGDSTRRQVIDLLKEKPRRAGELASAFAISAPALSRHLKVLRRAGLIEEQRDETDNRVRLFQLRQAPFVSLHAWLEQVEGFWTDQLSAFKAKAEQTFQQKFESDDSNHD
jgi:DNA-binding transcriptional ArsR family regulator